MSQPETTRILYDGECPFCASYVRFARLRNSLGQVELIDARNVPSLVADYAEQGYAIDDGMIVDTGQDIYYGGDAVWAINALVSNNPVLKLLGGRRFLKWIYPALRFGRNSVIKILGKQPIASQG